MKNNVSFKFEKGLLFININLKITVTNFMPILRKIKDFIVNNKFRFIVFDLRNKEYYNFLYFIIIEYLNIVVSKISGNITVFGGNKIINRRKYYTVKKEGSISDVFLISN